MNIYVGKNKAKARKITLKNLFLLLGIIKIKKAEIQAFRNSDNSSSSITIRQVNMKGAIDTLIEFNPENDNQIIEISTWKSLWILDEENMEKIT